jgi:hypothetical protein
MSAAEVALLSCVLQTSILCQLYPSQSTAVIAGCSVVTSLFLLATWKLYLWPLWFSPLRNLPEPPVSLLLRELSGSRTKNADEYARVATVFAAM